MRKFWLTRSDSDRLAGPILLLLFTVFVPSVGVVWMMREAVRNERLATEQLLREAYQTQLQSAGQTVRERWASQMAELVREFDPQQPAESFARLVSRPLVDSVLICNQQGQIVYPSQPVHTESLPEKGPQWREAEQLEFVERRFAEAVEAYEQLARGAHAAIQAQARQAQIRALLKQGDQAAAVEALQEQRQQTGLVNDRGRSFADAAA